MVALPTDVARSGERPRRAFETVFKAMVSALERSVHARRESPTTTARSIAALCVGGMIIARTMVDRRLADELRLACIATAMKLGGWNRKRRARAAAR
jgi:hypothetical protein